MNINEIAKLAGVSRATVSRYLNNGYVSEEKKKNISRVIEETGYQPSSQAQRLRTKKTKLVGVILPKIDSNTISREVAGISDILTKKGYQLILANTNNSVEEELKYLSLFRDNQVDGVIFIATILTKQHREMMKGFKVPIVLLGQQLDGYPCIFQDDYKAAVNLTEQMVKTGKKFGYITVTDKDEAVGRQRKSGVEKVLGENQITLESGCVKCGNFTLDQRTIRDKQVERAQKMLDSENTKKSRKNPNDPACFIEKTAVTPEGEAADIKYSLDENKIAEETLYDGLYAVCTDLLDDNVANILKVSEGRWQIEESRL